MNSIIPDSDIVHKIGLVLGRNVSLLKGGDVGSFEGFSEKDLSDFRLLDSRSGVLAISYIRYRLAVKVDMNVVVSFLAAVVQQGVTIQKWERPSK
ncbi:hypothetical protein HA052_06755 [Chromobacterium haemolyticum]|uniref:Uncharacterized protein n=1 Tax=Chromobacterium fluminis TaxID=3044269 RepID=A0ABX0KZF0_9NEIS|nr:hypothetical protein [Chromobacterium haemolyticum]NHR04894.1 hypothetical protein [Chromobacterium haemolyticum]